MLTNLDRIEGGSFQKLVPDDEHADRGRVGEVLSDATNENVVLARDLVRHREMVVFGIVNQLYARGIAQCVSNLVDSWGY